MAKIARHDDILKIIGLRKKISVGELTERLGVSEVTIRKDLTMLEDMGYLVRTRGGAALAEDREHLRTIEARRKEHVLEKEAVAGLASELVSDGDTIYIDSGSTCWMLARRLKEMNLRVVTNSIDVMVELADAPGIALFSLGGFYRKDAGSFIGPAALEAVRNFQIGTCFIGTTGITETGVFASQNTMEAQLKREVIGVSGRSVVLADHTKFRNAVFAVFAHAEEIDVLVMDEFPELPAVAALGIELMTARPGRTDGT